MIETAAGQWPLRRGSLIYPTPIAIACGRVLRARSAAERVNACLKAAEVLTRYLAAVAVASFASRDDDGDIKLSQLTGNLSFGHFLTTVQEVAGAKGNHPAAPLLAHGFKGTRQNKQSVRGKSDAALVALLELRNGDGHDLRNLDEAKAVSIEAKLAPVALLLEALDGVGPLLSKPLFVVEHQEWTREALLIRRLLLMGESSDPAPQFIKVGHETGGVAATRAPYLAINKCCLQLPPWLLWGIDHDRQHFALLFLDAIQEATARYCTLDGSEQHQGDGVAESIRQLLKGSRRAHDTVVLIDGRHLASEWADARKHIEESGRRQEGLVDWQAFEPTAVAWYSGLLDPTADDPHALIRERLLDGRANFDKHELHQLALLFGTKATVRAELGRDVLDIRIIDDDTKRPRKRELVESENLLLTLRRAVAFLSEAVASESLAPEDLRRMDGGVDYLTIREMLVNQIIHQDYSDSRTSAQIELYADKMTLMNAGYSLVPTGELVAGGRSQSRNPLIARALRAIGFAELSGSGIRALLRALRKARRKAPRFSSDEHGNTFKVTLEWTEDAPDVDAFWMELVGARLTSEQALVLNALAELPSASVVTLEGTTRIPLDELTAVLDFLVFQVLVEHDEANYRLAQHLREKLG
jgi:hypothetical protein